MYVLCGGCGVGCMCNCAIVNLVRVCTKGAMILSGSVKCTYVAVCTCSWEMDRSELESVLQKSDEGTALTLRTVMFVRQNLVSTKRAHSLQGAVLAWLCHFTS